MFARRTRASAGALASLAVRVTCAAMLLGAWPVSAQQPAPPLSPEEAARLAEERLAGEDSQQPAAAADEVSAPAPSPQEGEQINWLDLVLFRGGIFMYPIEAISIVVIAFGIERALGLRRRKVLPPELIGELGRLSSRPGGLDPQKAYKVCQQYPSAAANVIRACLLKVGRPHPEVEQAVAQASEREAAKLYNNVRPILLGISVAPLLGLLGTVQGMIMAFFVNVHLPAGANKAQALSQGIYTALVTTLAGLCVAIPASLLAHYYEGRIQNMFREIDELLMNMLPQLERFEGKLRVKRVEHGAKHEDPDVDEAGDERHPARAAE